MTVAERAGVAGVDPVLRRLGEAAWRSLPALVLLAVASFAIGFAAVWLLRDALMLVPIVVAALLSPLAAVALDAVHRELFDERTAVGFGRRTGIVAGAILVPAAMATWSAVAAGIADASGSVLFQVVAVAAVLVAVVLALLAIVTVPISSMRADVSLHTVVTFSLLVVVRRPWAPLTALAATAAVAWLGLTVFSGLLALAAPLLVVLSIAAAWPMAHALGAALPALAAVPTRRSTSMGIPEQIR